MEKKVNLTIFFNYRNYSPRFKMLLEDVFYKVYSKSQTYTSRRSGSIISVHLFYSAFLFAAQIFHSKHRYVIELICGADKCPYILSDILDHLFL